MSIMFMFLGVKIQINYYCNLMFGYAVVRCIKMKV